MEFTFTLRYLQGSVVPIVTTQATALGTPFNAAPAPPPEVTQTLNQPLPQQQQQRGRGVERGRRNWRGGYRGWRDGNREWQGDNRKWQGDNRRWQGDNRRGWYDRDHGSRRRGSGGDQIDRRGGDQSDRRGGDQSDRRGGDVSDSRGGLRNHEEGGVGTGSKRNSGRHGEASASKIAIDRVPDEDVPSSSGCDDGERRKSAFKGQCSKCYEEGHRRKDCPYKVTYRVLTPSDTEVART